MRPSRTITKQRCPFHHRGLECKSRKSRQKSRLVTKGNKSSLLPGVTGKFGLGVQNEAGQSLTVLPRECPDFSKHSLSTAQDMTLHMDIIRWSIPKSDYTLCRQRWRNSIQPTKTRRGADCGSDHELLIAKFRCKLKKVEQNH